MLDVEKFLIALRSNKDVDGKLKPIHLADTVQEEIKIIQAAVENSRRKWVGLTDGEIDILSCEMVKGYKSVNWLCKVLEAKLKEKNHG